MDQPLAATPPDLSVVERCKDPSIRGSAREGVRRLSKAELASALARIVGGLYWQVEAKVNELPEAWEPQPGESFQPLHGLSEVEAWIEIATSAAESFTGNGRQHDLSADHCLNQPAPSAACKRDFVRSLGALVFRRPLQSDEVSLYLSAFDQELGQGAGTEAIERLLTRLLLAPDFMFHVELGAGDPTTRIRLTDHEVANRIAFAITAAPPDQALEGAATRGELQTIARVETQVRRLLETPLARVHFRDFVHEWLVLRGIPDPTRLLGQAAGFPYDDPQNLHVELEGELLDYVSYVIWSMKGSFHDLMTAPIAFPTQARTASLYRTSTTSAEQPLDTPDHPGLITRAALLVSPIEATSPILRGVAIRRRMLCDPLPTPDFSIVSERLTTLGAHDHMTTPNHAIVSDTTSAAVCTGCHKLINPVGFLLEEFDALGRSQSKENVYGWDPYFHAAALAQHPLPGRQDNLFVEMGLPTSYARAAELAEALGNSQKARTCLALRLFRYVQRRPERAEDACALRETRDALAGDMPILEALVRSVANEDIFWRAAP